MYKKKTNMDKKILPILIFSLLLLNIISVSAITASIGNARMILRAEKGDELEKYILVKNVNDVAIKINLTASGDLKDFINIIDNEFTLQPGEDKKAYFTIEVKKSGTTESQVNVQFIPVDGKNGVGLSSTIIVVAGEKGSLDEENVNTDETDGSSSTNSSSTGITGNVIGNINKNIIALGTTLIVALVFIVVLIIYYKFKKNNFEKENKYVKKVVKTKPKKKVEKRG